MILYPGHRLFGSVVVVRLTIRRGLKVERWRLSMAITPPGGTFSLVELPIMYLVGTDHIYIMVFAYICMYSYVVYNKV